MFAATLNYRVAGGGFVASLQTAANQSAVAGIYAPHTSPLTVTGTILITTIGNEITLQAPTNISTINWLEIGQQSYQLVSLGSELNPGQFTFNPITSVVTIALKQSIRIGQTVRYWGLGKVYTNKIPTTYVGDIPQLFKTWNVTGEIKRSRQLAGHPTLEFRFFAPPTQEASINSAFTPGQFFSAWGIIPIL